MTITWWLFCCCCCFCWWWFLVQLSVQSINNSRSQLSYPFAICYCKLLAQSTRPKKMNIHVFEIGHLYLWIRDTRTKCGYSNVKSNCYGYFVWSPLNCSFMYEIANGKDLLVGRKKNKYMIWTTTAPIIIWKFAGTIARRSCVLLVNSACFFLSPFDSYYVQIDMFMMRFFFSKWPIKLINKGQKRSIRFVIFFFHNDENFPVFHLTNIIFVDDS